jgi:sensor domain CHASE-containing protein
MSDLSALGRFLILIGAVIVLIGGVLLWIGKTPGLGWLGRLPGDIYIERKNFSFYFPLTTGLIISLILSLILWLLTRR